MSAHASATLAIMNPTAAAGSARRRAASLRAVLQEAFGPIDLRTTAGPGDATALVREAVGQGAPRVLVIGGDGTFNEAVNGLVTSGGEVAGGTCLVPIPAGTGGDFARSVGLTGLEGQALADALARAAPRAIDAGRATYRSADGRDQTRLFVNISSFGASGMVVDQVNRSTKAFGGKASFMLGTVRALLRYRCQRVRLRVDEAFDEEVLINTVAVANGRFFGGSMMVAPNARLDDGLLDVVVIGDLGLGGFVRNGGRLYQGTHLSLPEVRALRGRVVRAEPLGAEPVLIDLDGEQPGRLPVHYEVLPGAVTVLAPWERAVAVGR